MSSPIVLGAGLLVLLLLVQAGLEQFFSNETTPPVYGPWFLPRFIRGLMAVASLGADEDAFLCSSRERHGDIVYLPWPLGQYFVLKEAAIKEVYADTKTLDFKGVRKQMQHEVFGSTKELSYDPIMEKKYFPTHSRHMTKEKLGTALSRFVCMLQQRVDGLRRDIGAESAKINLQEWAVEAQFAATTAGFFGDAFLARTEASTHFNLASSFALFDGVFPLLASGLIPPFLLQRIPLLRDGIAGRDATIREVGAWAHEGMPGLGPGDVVYEMGQVSLTAGDDPYTTGSLLNADMWASQANAPFAFVHLLLYVLQSPPALVDELRREIEPVLASKSPSDWSFDLLGQLPLSESIVHETLRLSTSAFSIRYVDPQRDFLLNVPADGQRERCYVIPKGSKVICGTRSAHLDPAVWTRPAEWDPKRFLGAAGEKRVRDSHSFGGGVSQCEGRRFAMAELVSFLALFILNFDADLRPHSTDPEQVSRHPPLSIAGVEGTTPVPRGLKRADGRPGLGVFQQAAGTTLWAFVRRREA